MKKFLPFLFLFVFFSMSAVSADTFVDVYRDGYVGVEQSVEFENLQMGGQIELLSEDVENLFVTDSKGDTIYYELDGPTLTIYSTGEELVDVSYYTGALTSKESASWSLALNATDSVVVTLPRGSTIFYIDPLPEMIDLEENKFTFPKGSNVTLEYLFGIEDEEEKNQMWIYLVALAVSLMLIAGLVILKKPKQGKRRNWNKDKRLDPMERRVLQHIYENDDVMESEIRDLFNLPKTSSWRMMRRLEEYGYISIEKRNKVNFIKVSRKS